MLIILLSSFTIAVITPGGYTLSKHLDFESSVIGDFTTLGTWSVPTSGCKEGTKCLLNGNGGSAGDYYAYIASTDYVKNSDTTSIIAKAWVKNAVNNDGTYQSIMESFVDATHLYAISSFSQYGSETWDAVRTFEVYRDGGARTITEMGTILDPPGTGYEWYWQVVSYNSTGASIALYTNETEGDLIKYQNITKSIDTGEGYMGFYCIRGCYIDDVYIFEEIPPTTLGDAKICYSFDDVDTSGTTLTDLGSQGNDGILTGDGITTGVTGISNQAYTFDGSADYVVSTSVTGISGADARSFSVWVYDTSWSNSGFLEIGSAGNYQLTAIGYWTNGIYFFGYSNDWDTTTTLTTSAWHHIVYTTNGTQLEIYIDGVRTGTGHTLGHVLETADTTLKVADYQSSFFSGTIDEVIVYDRVLSEEEIAYLSTGVGCNDIMVSTTNTGLYQDLQGWCPTVDGILSNLSAEITQSGTGNVLFRYNATNSSLSTSEYINLSTNGTNNVDFDLSANDCIYYEFYLDDTSTVDTPKITSYIINEIDYTHFIKTTVQDTSSNPIMNATVIIIDESDNSFFGNYTTNISGQIAVDIGYGGNFSVLAYNSSSDVNGSMVAHVEVLAQ